MPADLDPPELGNEDEVFTGLLEQARRNVACRPLLLIAADPPRRDDTPAAAEAKAVAVAQAWAEQHGGRFGGVLPNKQQRGQRAAS